MGVYLEGSVEDYGQLAGDGDESDEFRLSSSDEFVAEAIEVRIVARGDHGTDEQGGKRNTKK